MKAPVARLACAMAFAGSMAVGGPAAARVEKPYCASNRGHEFTATVCDFATLEECRKELLGMGGWCHLNPYYVPPKARNDSTGRSPRRAR